jgi:hypothetical protein
MASGGIVLVPQGWPRRSSRVFDGFDLAMVQRHGRIRIIAIAALVLVSAISFSTFGFSPTVETVVFWPIMLIAWVFGDMAAPANIGTPEAPLYEATPVHFFIGLIGFAGCLVYWYGAFSLAALYYLYPWLRSERRDA